jgi:biotin carboxylase
VGLLKASFLFSVHLALVLLAYSVPAFATATGDKDCHRLVHHHAPTEIKRATGEYVIVVDPFREGSFTAPALTARGYRPIYVKTHEDNPVGVGFDSSPFIKGFSFAKSGQKLGNIERLLQELRSLDAPIAGVIPGTETAPELTAQLAKALGLPGNVTTLSHLWSDKYDLQEHLAKIGIESPETFLARSAAEAIHWAEAVYGKWPVIVKPRDGMGSFGVSVCHSAEEVKRAFDAILGEYTPRGTNVSSVLVQEFIDTRPPEQEDGDKAELHIVELVGHAGRYKTAYMEKYHHLDASSGRVSWEYVDTVDPNANGSDLLIETAKRAALHAGVHYGASHWEIYLIRKNGKLSVKFLDLGARIGGGMHMMTTLATERDIVVSNADAFLNEEAAFQAIPDKFELKKHVWHVGLNVMTEGNTRKSEADVIRALSGLSSFELYKPFGPDGAKLEVTKDLLSMSGWIYLANEDLEQLKRDYLFLRYKEHLGAFYSGSEDVIQNPTPQQQPGSVKLMAQ